MQISLRVSVYVYLCVCINHYSSQWQFRVVFQDLKSKKKALLAEGNASLLVCVCVCEADNSWVDEWLRRCAQKWLHGGTRTLNF